MVAFGEHRPIQASPDEHHHHQPVKRKVLRAARLLLLQGWVFYHRERYTAENATALLPQAVLSQLASRIQVGQKKARDLAQQQHEARQLPPASQSARETAIQRAAHLLHAKYTSTFGKFHLGAPDGGT